MKNKLKKIEYGVRNIYDLIYYETLAKKDLEVRKGGKK